MRKLRRCSRGGGNQLLLRDVHLEIALWMRVREGLGERRVGDLAVECHDVGSSGPERGERVAVRLSRGDLGTKLVARELECSARRLLGNTCVGRPAFLTCTGTASTVISTGAAEILTDTLATTGSRRT